MLEKYKLNSIVAIAILVVSIWLILGLRIWDSVGLLLQGCAIALIIWALLKKDERTVKLLEFFVKSIVISYAITSIIWFLQLGNCAPSNLSWYFAHFGLGGFVYPLVYIILPRSLLPVAISVIVYGIFKTKLRLWQILVSSWYASIFVVYAAYSVGWALFVQPYLHNFYSSGAGAIALDMLLVLLAFFIACIFSIVYVVIKGPKEEHPP